MIEKLNKKTKEVTKITIKQFLTEDTQGTKGKLNMMVELAEGNILQNLEFCWRLKGLEKYQWDWNE